MRFRIIDAIAEMLKAGIITSKGHFVKKEEQRIQWVNGTPEFVLVSEIETGTRKPISVTQDDIAEIMLAKAAIHTGCTILMKEKNVAEEN